MGWRPDTALGAEKPVEKSQERPLPQSRTRESAARLELIQRKQDEDAAP